VIFHRLTLPIIATVLLTSLLYKKTEVLERINPYSDFRVAQSNPISVKKPKWVSLSESEDIISFVDVFSISEFGKTKVRSINLYVLPSPLTIDGEKVDVAIRDVISDCKSYTMMTISTTYLTKDNVKKLVDGSGEEIKAPQDSIAYDEIEKVCTLHNFKHKRNKEKIFA
jgi:hypothetical protein